MAYSFKVKPGDTKLYYASNDELIEMLKKAEDEIRRLQQIQNFSTVKPRYEVGQLVYYVRRHPFNSAEFVVESARITKIYKGKTKITYYTTNRRAGFSEKELYPEYNLALIKIAEIEARRKLQETS